MKKESKPVEDPLAEYLLSSMYHNDDYGQANLADVIGILASAVRDHGRCQDGLHRIAEAIDKLANVLQEKLP